MASGNKTGFLLGITAGVFLMLGTLVGLIVSATLGEDGDRTRSGLEGFLGTEANTPVPAGPYDSRGFVDIAEAATPAVVNISTSRTAKESGKSPFGPFLDDPFFRRFFGDEFLQPFEHPQPRKQQGMGSGVIVDSTGYIITNNHVVEDADRIRVLLSDKREFDAKLIGVDPKTDLAVIKIEDGNLPTISWGNSENLKVGEYVLAIGNPFGLNQTVTMGIVSAIGRANVGIAEYEDFIQTDAAINPGNSGGALVNVRGELIGINTAIFSQSGGYMGVGFAVPSKMAKLIMESLIKSGKVTRGWLGVSIQNITPDLARQFNLSETRGALISDLIAGSPAAKGGMEQGDVIVAFDGAKVETTTELRNHVARTPVGKRVEVGVIRDEKSMVLEIVIGEQPKDMDGLKSVPSTGEDEPVSSSLEGITVGELTPDRSREFGFSGDIKGVVILNLKGGSKAEDAGLQKGDVIVEINRKKVRSLDEFNEAAKKIGRNEAVLFLINRGGRHFYLSVKP